MTAIGYATLGLKDRDLGAALDIIAETGFTQAEILGQKPHVDPPPTGRALAAFRARLQARGLAGGTVHAPMGRFVLGAPEEDWRQGAARRLAEYVEFAAAIDASGIVIHPVPNPTLVPHPESPESLRRVADATRRSLDGLVVVAQKAGVRILLENLPYHCRLPFLSMKELRSLVDSYPASALGLVVDTGHAWTSGRDPAEEILAAGPRLWGTHLQDVDRDHPADDHWPPTHGGLNWDAIRAALGQINYAGAWTFEVCHGRNDETPEKLARVCRSVAEAWGLQPSSGPTDG